MRQVLFYTNQFFGGGGGEERAYMEPVVHDGAIGAANLFDGRLEDAKIVKTVVCGDNYYAENMELAKKTIAENLDFSGIDLVIAGPAFNAGRFGIACADFCAFVTREYAIEALTGLHAENPAVEMYKRNIYIIETGSSAAGMKKAVDRMIPFAGKLLRGEPIGLPKDEGYIPRGKRINIFKEKSGAERALDMLVRRLTDEPFETEVELPNYSAITPAPPIRSLKDATIALVTSGGIVPMGNADRLPAATAKHFFRYSIEGLDAMETGRYECVHAGYDPVYANRDPNRVLPLDALRDFEKRGVIKSIYPFYTATTGNSTSVADATRMGAEIAEILKKDGVDGVILTST